MFIRYAYLGLVWRCVLFGFSYLASWGQTKSPDLQSGDVVDGIIFHKQPVVYKPGQNSWLNFALKMPSGWKLGTPVRGVLCVLTWKDTPDGVMGNLRGNAPLLQWAARNQFALLSWSRLRFYTTGTSNDEMGDDANKNWGLHGMLWVGAEER